MGIKIVFLLTIGLLTVVSNIFGVRGQQLDGKFIVKIGHFDSPFLSEKCVGTLISEQHILSTASCVAVRSPTQIAIIISSYFEITTRIVIHPFYDNNRYTNNAALLMTTTFRSNPQLGFVPRQLEGFLSTTSSCNLFGWGGESMDPRRDAVFVEAPVDCDINNPQNYCSVFDSVTHASCSALEASPLTCDNDMILAGFVTDAGCVTHANGSAGLSYHSIGDFQDWIDGVIGPELHERPAVNFIVTITEKNTIAVPRCFGTVISSNRVLTTATCATIDSIEVQTRFLDGAWTTTQNFSTTEVRIHPSFHPEKPFENNVAIVSVNGSFNAKIVPRTLGSLQGNSACQLFGWGPTDLVTRGDAITVSSPQECNVSQAFCSSHPTIFHHSCSGLTGSPVTCSGDEGVVAGFLINNGTCSSDSKHVSLSYHSVSDFLDWISDLESGYTDPDFPDPTDDQLTDEGVTIKISTVFVLFVVLISCVIVI